MIIIPTIDVEAAHGDEPFSQMILGECGRTESWGTLRQAKVFHDFGVSATFFIDCYEYTLWGREPFERLCCELLALGQDVQLHTHPSWRDDPRDSSWLRAYKRDHAFMPQHYDLMAKLPFDLQVEVLEHGAELIRSWTGTKPVAHRSGGYSINEDTLRALRQTGIFMDSSMNAAHPNSCVAWTANVPCERDGLLELPVTLMRYRFGVPWGRGWRRGKLLKTDLDIGSLDDLLHFVRRGSEQGLPVMNLFMHSYSLLNFDYGFRKIHPSRAKLHRLTEFLRRSQSIPGAQFMNCSQYASTFRRSEESIPPSDRVPEIRSQWTAARMAVRKTQYRLQEMSCHARIGPAGGSTDSSNVVGAGRR